MFLLITLCIILWYMMRCHKKRKLYSTDNVHFMSPSSFHNSNTLAHAFELKDMKTNDTGTGLGMDTSTCK